MINLDVEIGRGKERSCFLHPYDNKKVIKIVHSHESKQMEREVRIYRELAKKTGLVYEHFPDFYGQVMTNKGIGYVFDLVENFNGSVPRTLHSYLKTQSTVEDFLPQLSELKTYLLDHSIVFCNDMSYDGNILVKEFANGSNRLVVIDGLGDAGHFTWLNNVKFLLKRKIERRWDRLVQRLRNVE